MRLGIQIVVPRHQIGVGIVGFNNRNQILLLRHVFHPKAPWSIPGGWLNRNESPAECAVRELREETGISAALGPAIHVFRDAPPPHLGITYVAHIEHDPVSLSSEIIEWGWFAPNEMPGPLLPFVQLSIEKAVQFIQEKEEHWSQTTTVQVGAGLVPVQDDEL
jgi:ADP-ribose pyrophosphatase YjhB (NUDIX family)